MSKSGVSEGLLTESNLEFSKSDTPWPELQFHSRNKAAFLHKFNVASVDWTGLSKQFIKVIVIH